MNQLYLLYKKRNKCIRVVLMLIALVPIFAFGQQRKLVGTVTSFETNMPIVGATLRIAQTTVSTVTDSLGNFSIVVPIDSGYVICNSIGYDEKKIRFVSSQNYIDIALSMKQDLIDEVVIVKTGYQSLPKERATGSFDLINKKLVNRSVSTDILSRLENLSPGLLFNHGDAANTDSFLIRGRNTITGDAQPLIVLNDFPYEGDINNINPNDIESVTILKDAAAASIWGARAGNGVIVITTKTGTTKSPRIELVANLSVSGRPNLGNIDMISSGDRIELEKFLFDQGRYNAAKTPANAVSRFTPIPQAVELMIQSPDDLDQQLSVLTKGNSIAELEKYFYRNAVNQQYGLNISGQQEKVTYYLSGGLDRNIADMVGKTYNRVSIRSANTFQLSEKLSIDANVNLFSVTDKEGNNNGYMPPQGSSTNFSPYTRLVGMDKESLPVYQMMRRGFIDTVGNGSLLDWNYRPYDEIGLQTRTNSRKDYLANVGVNYAIIPGLRAIMKYQFQNQQDRIEHLYREESYYTRNMINDFTQINRNMGTVLYPFPRGAVLHTTFNDKIAHQGRAQLTLDKSFNDKHLLNALSGFEIRKIVTGVFQNQNLGYSEETGAITNVIDLVSNFRRNTTGTNGRVNIVETTSELRDNFISFYANGAYTFDRRYTLSGSFRKDEANLFGLNANQKGTPLWSIGGMWDISNEAFYNLEFIPHLKLRATYGANGNISRIANAMTTVTLLNGGISHALPIAVLGTPPNKNLSWERIKQFNLGLEFATKENRLSGSIDYYTKVAGNLLSQTPVDPTYGVRSMYMNVADMQTNGLDMQLNVNNSIGNLKWHTLINYSLSKGKVTNYLMPVSNLGRTYLPVSLANPLVGRPLFSVFALNWNGLDAETGDPIGMVDGSESRDYNAIYNSTTLDELSFIGVAQPLHFGAIMNTLSYKNIDLSFNISYKGGYYFRRQSVFYSVLYNGFGGHADYAERWQKPGDELTTDVPSRVYPVNNNRDNFYQFSEALVEPGDHLRLEDINIGYSFSNSKSFRSLRLFCYITQLPVLWVSNGKRIDPYFNNIPKPRTSFSWGINLNL